MLLLLLKSRERSVPSFIALEDEESPRVGRKWAQFRVSSRHDGGETASAYPVTSKLLLPECI